MHTGAALVAADEFAFSVFAPCFAIRTDALTIDARLSEGGIATGRSTNSETWRTGARAIQAALRIFADVCNTGLPLLSAGAAPIAAERLVLVVQAGSPAIRAFHRSIDTSHSLRGIATGRSADSLAGRANAGVARTGLRTKTGIGLTTASGSRAGFASRTTDGIALSISTGVASIRALTRPIDTGHPVGRVTAGLSADGFAGQTDTGVTGTLLRIFAAFGRAALTPGSADAAPAATDLEAFGVGAGSAPIGAHADTVLACLSFCGIAARFSALGLTRWARAHSPRALLWSLAGVRDATASWSSTGAALVAADGIAPSIDARQSAIGAQAGAIDARETTGGIATGRTTLLRVFRANALTAGTCSWFFAAAGNAAATPFAGAAFITARGFVVLTVWSAIRAGNSRFNPAQTSTGGHSADHASDERFEHGPARGLCDQPPCPDIELFAVHVCSLPGIGFAGSAVHGT